MIFSIIFDSASESMGLFSLAGVFAPIVFSLASIGVPIVFSHFFVFCIMLFGMLSFLAHASLAWHLLFCPYSFWHIIFAERKSQPF
jgi:hypothetical protein